jgi:hypothetical protein
MGSFITGFTALGRGIQRFCDDGVNKLVLKNVTIRNRGVKNVLWSSDVIDEYLINSVIKMFFFVIFIKTFEMWLNIIFHDTNKLILLQWKDRFFSEMLQNYRLWNGTNIWTKLARTKRLRSTSLKTNSSIVESLDSPEQRY